MTTSVRVVKVLAVVEDHPDVRLLIRVLLSEDDRLEIVNEAASAEEALAMAHELGGELGVIILDQMLETAMTGIEVAPLLKQEAPDAKILLFTAYATAMTDAAAEPAIDEVLLKTHTRELLPMVRHLAGLD